MIHGTRKLIYLLPKRNRPFSQIKLENIFKSHFISHPKPLMEKNQKKSPKPKDNTKAEFDAGSRKRFLLTIKNHSKIKAKEKKKLAKEALAKSRAELRQKHKQERQEFLNQLVNERGTKIDRLPLFADDFKNQITMAEVEASNPTEVKISVLDVNERPEDLSTIE